MIIIRQKKILRSYLGKLRIKNKIAFIPTMGSIHEGHLSLLKKSKKKKCISCVSIFINPAQFNNKKDFELYPKNEKKDLELLKKNGLLLKLHHSWIKSRIPVKYRETEDIDLTPIFIVGTNRSGTSMVTSLLSQHPDLEGIFPDGIT